MKKNNLCAFTLVELVVVLVIVSILSTLWFVAYVDYLKWVRDSSRVQQMTEMYDAFTLYWVRSSLPSPWEWISINFWSVNVWIQWYADEGVLESIKYSDGWLDPKTKKPYSYFMSKDRKWVQLLWYFEEKAVWSIPLPSSSLAEDEYSNLTPQVFWDEIGILIDESSYAPLQEMNEMDLSGSINILSYTWSLISFANNDIISSGSGVNLISIVPNTSCKNILNTFPGAESWLYKINTTNNTKKEVYCDMETDGGWWTFWAYISANASVYDVFFDAEAWTYDSLRGSAPETYSINLANLYHTEMIMLLNESDITIADSSNNFLRFKYDIFTPGFYIWPIYLPNWSAFFWPWWDETWLSYSTSLSSDMIPTTRDRFWSAWWWIGSNTPDIPWLVRIWTWNFGVYKYPSIWGDTWVTTSGNSAYIYVR